jgi:hypothetical protein
MPLFVKELNGPVTLAADALKAFNSELLPTPEEPTII